MKNINVINILENVKGMSCRSLFLLRVYFYYVFSSPHAPNAETSSWFSINMLPLICFHQFPGPNSTSAATFKQTLSSNKTISVAVLPGVPIKFYRV